MYKTCEDNFNLTTTEVDHLTIRKVLDLTLVVAHHLLNVDHIGGVDIYLLKVVHRRTRMVGVHMCSHQRHRLRRNARYNLIQILDVRAGIDEQRTLLALDNVERLIGHHLTITLPRVGINLAERNILALINHFLLIGHARLRHSHRAYKAQQG